MLSRSLQAVIFGLFMALSTPGCAGAHDFLSANEAKVTSLGENLQKAAKALALLDQLAGDSVEMSGTPEQLDALGVAIWDIQDAEKSLHASAEALRGAKLTESFDFLKKALSQMSSACTALEAVGVDASEVRGLLADVAAELP